MCIATKTKLFGSSVLARLHGTKGRIMKKVRKKTAGKQSPREYDFKGGVQGKYAARYAKGSNVIVLSPDVAKVFPDSTSANRALRAFVDMMEKLPNFTVKPKR